MAIKRCNSIFAKCIIYIKLFVYEKWMIFIFKGSIMFEIGVYGGGVFCNDLFVLRLEANLTAKYQISKICFVKILLYHL